MLALFAFKLSGAMSWDVAFYGELAFPDADAIARWRRVDIDPAAGSPLPGDTTGGRVDDVLKPLGGGHLDWIDTTVNGTVVTVRGILTRDAYNDQARPVAAALRAAGDVGARGEVWVAGLETDHSYLVTVGSPGSTERKKRALGDPRLSAVITESGRRVASQPPPPKPARELHQLAQVKNAARIIEILETAPKAGYWDEVRLLDPQVSELHARFGADVFPILLALRARLNQYASDEVIDIFMKLETAAATELLAGLLESPLRLASMTTWLLAHPDLAKPALERLAEQTPVVYDDGRVGSIAPINEIARRLLAELAGMRVAPGTALPAPLRAKTRSRPPKWFHPVGFARPLLADGTPLSTEASSRLVALLKSCKGGDASAFDAILPALDRLAFDALLLELFHVWGSFVESTKGDGFINDAMRVLGGPHAREQLAVLAREKTNLGRRARALL